MFAENFLYPLDPFYFLSQTNLYFTDGLARLMINDSVFYAGRAYVCMHIFEE